MSSSAGHTHHGEAHQKPLVGSMGVDSRKLGLWAFIGSETLFFATLILTHLIFYARTTNTLSSVDNALYASWLRCISYAGASFNPS